MMKSAQTEKKSVSEKNSEGKHSIFLEDRSKSGDISSIQYSKDKSRGSVFEGLFK